MALRRRLGSHSILGGVRKHRERLAERAGQMQWERTASVHMRSAMPVTADAEALKPPLGCVRSAIRKESRARCVLVDLSVPRLPTCFATGSASRSTNINPSSGNVRRRCALYATDERLRRNAHHAAALKVQGCEPTRLLAGQSNVQRATSYGNGEACRNGRRAER